MRRSRRPPPRRPGLLKIHRKIVEKSNLVVAGAGSASMVVVRATVYNNAAVARPRKRKVRLSRELPLVSAIEPMVRMILTCVKYDNDASIVSFEIHYKCANHAVNCIPPGLQYCHRCSMKQSR